MLNVKDLFSNCIGVLAMFRASDIAYHNLETAISHTSDIGRNLNQ